MKDAGHAYRTRLRHTVRTRGLMNNKSIVVEIMFSFKSHEFFAAGCESLLEFTVGQRLSR
jgi:hypothetical protein